MSDLFNLFKSSLPSVGGNGIYENFFSSGTAITSMDSLFSTSRDELANRSKNLFGNYPTTDIPSLASSYLIDNLISNSSDSNPCQTNEELTSANFTELNNRAFNKLLENIFRNKVKFTSGGTDIVFSEMGELIRYIKNNPSKETELKTWLDVQIRKEPCYDTFHQETARLIQEQASDFITNATETKEYKLKFNLDANSAKFAENYSIILTSTLDPYETIGQYSINENGEIVIINKQFNNIDVTSADQPSISATSKLVDKNGVVIQTFTNTITIPNNNSTIELTSSGSVVLSPPAIPLVVATVDTELLYDFQFKIQSKIPGFEFNDGLGDFFSEMPDFKNVNYVLQNPGALIPAGLVYGVPLEQLEMIEALIYVSLVTVNIDVAMTLVASGIRSIIDISDKLPEDIVSIEDVEDTDITTQVGDYNLYETHENASLVANLLDEQTFEWSTEYDNA